VTLDEALSELGLDRDAGADQARRAYLRLLKVRKPETDPQGFMRLREAYELAKGRLEARDAMFRALGGPFEPVIARPAPPPEVFEPPPKAREPAPPAHPVEEPLPPVEEPEPPRLEEPEAPAAPPEAPPARAEEPEVPPAAIAEEEPAARAEEQEEPSPGEQEQGEEEHAEEEQDEEEQDEEEREEPDEEEEQEPDEEAPRVEKRPTLVAMEMAEVFDEAAKNVTGPTPPVLPALDLLVTLHAEDEGGIAGMLHASVANWLRTSGQEARVLRGDAAARWSLLRELHALPATFPGRVRGAIGRAMAAGDVGAAKAELAVFQRRERGLARAAAGTLRAKAPLLAAALAQTLDPPLVTTQPVAPTLQNSGGGSSKGYLAIVGVVLALLRIVMALGRSPSTTSYNPSLYNPSLYDRSRFNLPVLPGADGGVYFPGIDASIYFPQTSSSPKLDNLWAKVVHGAESTKRHAESMMAQDGGRLRVDYKGVAKDADAVSNAALLEDCTGARAAMSRLRTRMRADVAAWDLAGRVEAESLERALNTYCAELVKARTPQAGAKAEAGSPKLDAGRCGGTDQP
jgi:hypothetical protein